ncbi:MAG: phospholipase D-like domain-containing protein [Phycisphaerae bacterium]
MDAQRLDDILRRSLDDLRLSRSEKRAIQEVFGEAISAGAAPAWIRNRAFEMAGSFLDGADNQAVLEWLHRVVKAVETARPPDLQQVAAEVCFSRRDNCPKRIAGLFDSARRSVDICVFTITDDRISRAMIDAHRRGVHLRVITDDDKAGDRGSDVDRFLREGMDLRTDASRFHMHHKFAIFDARCLLTGSYNWTRGAAEHNQENFILTEDPRLVEPFIQRFGQLWQGFADNGG